MKYFGTKNGYATEIWYIKNELQYKLQSWSDNQRKILSLIMTWVLDHSFPGSSRNVVLTCVSIGRFLLLFGTELALWLVHLQGLRPSPLSERGRDKWEPVPSPVSRLFSDPGLPGTAGAVTLSGPQLSYCSPLGDPLLPLWHPPLPPLAHLQRHREIKGTRWQCPQFPATKPQSSPRLNPSSPLPFRQRWKKSQLRHLLLAQWHIEQSRQLCEPWLKIGSHSKMEIQIVLIFLDCCGH